MKMCRLAGFALAASVSFSTTAIVVAQQKPQATPPASEKPEVKAQANPVMKTQPNADAVTLVDFKARIDKYLEVRNTATKDAPSLKETKDPAKIKTAQDAQGVLIRAARANAKPGDIFTHDIRGKFRRLLSPELKGEDGADAKKTLKDDAPSVSAIPFKVNATYPEGKPLPTVPVNLLLNLPTLPKELEYRIIDKHLILRDVDANIIVDYIPNAIR